MVNSGSSRQSSRSLRFTGLSWVIIAAIVCVLILTPLLDRELATEVHANSASALQHATDNAAIYINDRLLRYSDLLSSSRSFVTSSQPALPSQTAFAAYYKALQQSTSDVRPGTILFVANYTTTQQERFIVERTSQGQPSLTNLATDTATLLLFEQARDSGTVVSSASLPTMHGLCLVLPVYGSSVAPTTLADRRAELEGFVLANVPFADLLNAPLGQADSRLTYKVYGGPTLQAPLFVREAAGTTNSQSTAVTLSVPGGLSWQLVANAPAGFASAQSDQQMHELVIILGSALVILLIIALYFQTRNGREQLIENSKDEFVSLVSHQLRAPLTSIRLYVEMLLNEEIGSLTHKQREYLNIIQLSSHRMADLVTEFLDVSRLELGQTGLETKVTHIEDVIETVVEQASPIASQKGLTIVYDKPHLPGVAIEPSLYTQIVDSLLNNAIRYTPRGGSIMLSIERNNEGYQLDVVDTGIGIPDEARSKIFERFYRADNAKRVESEGTGLGLYLVKQIVDRSKGRVWYDSVPGQGCKFHVIIPLTGMVSKVKP